jgi:hypothetical protein
MSKVALSLAADTVPEISAAATVPSSILEALIELSAIPDLGNFVIAIKLSLTLLFIYIN